MKNTGINYKILKLKRHQKLYAHRHQTGTAPGTLKSAPDAVAPRLTLTAYNEQRCEEISLGNAEEIVRYRQEFPMVWLQVAGLGDTAVIESIGSIFNLHPLALEDTLNLHQRAKIDDFDNFLFAVMRMPVLTENGLESEQVSFFIGENFLLSFQEKPSQLFSPVHARLDVSSRRQRLLKPDYLLYALIDSIIDAYFPVLEGLGDTLNELEDRIIENPRDHTIEKIHDIKHDLNHLRHDIWPLREALSRLSADMPFIQEKTRYYVRDCQDHVMQINDILETYRERASSLTDIYLSSLSNRMNEVMKVLTIIATLFIPLSFIAGVYGMNFDKNISPFNMPELEWIYGYPYALGLMLVTAIGLLLFFRHKKWL